VEDVVSFVERRQDFRSRDGLIALAASGLVAAALFNPLHPVLAVGLAIAPLAMIAASRFVYLLCVAFVAFSFFRLHEAFPVLLPLRIPQLLAIPTLGMLMWHILVTRTVAPFWSRELSAFAVFFGLVTCGLVFAVNRQMAVDYWTATYVKIGLMVFAIAWLTRGPAEFALASRTFVISGSAIAFVAMSNKLRGIGLVEGTRATIGRDIDSVLGDPNDLSLVLLFPLSFSLALMTTRTRALDRILGAVGVVLIATAIVATQSRGGLLGALAVFAVFGARMIKSKTLLIAIGVIGTLALFAAAGISGRASGGAAEAGIDESSMGRIYAWGAAWRMALARPLNGVGIDNFVANYFFYTGHWDGLNHAVHSTWFNVLAESGFPGIIAFVTMIAFTARSALQSSRRIREADAPPAAKAISIALVAGIAGFCVAGTFLTQGFTWPIYILLALTAATSRYATGLTSGRAEDEAGSGARSPADAPTR